LQLCAVGSLSTNVDCGVAKAIFHKAGFIWNIGMITTAIIEDDPVVIGRLSIAIAQTDDIRIVWTAQSAAAARPLMAKGGFDVLLCDLGLPDGDGIDLIREAKKIRPETDIIVITIFAQQRKVIDSIRAGAQGYLLKDNKLVDCVESIREIRRGGSPISPIIARQLLKQMMPEPAEVARPLDVDLSQRESEVLNLLARGFSYNEIATLLSLAPSSIGTYVKRIYKKLEVNSRAEAVFEASNRGIINVH
jgi:DNA-binding NarL/FixJ family response regulator